MAGPSGDDRAKLGRFLSLRFRADAASQMGDHEAALGLGLSLAGFLAGEGRSPEDEEFTGRMASEAHYGIVSACDATQSDGETLNEANCPEWFRFSEINPTDLERIKNSKYLKNLAPPPAGLQRASGSNDSGEEKSAAQTTQVFAGGNQQSGISLGQTLYQAKLTSLYCGASSKVCEEAETRHVQRADGPPQEASSKHSLKRSLLKHVVSAPDKDAESCLQLFPAADVKQPAYRNRKPEVEADNCDYDHYKRHRSQTKTVTRGDWNLHDADDIERVSRPQTAHPNVQRGKQGMSNPGRDGGVDTAAQEFRSSFMTAREHQAIQEGKKHTGPSSEVRFGDYGCSKKKLGPASGYGEYPCATKALRTRDRGPGSQFVPPVKDAKVQDGNSWFQCNALDGGKESTRSCLESLAGPDGQLPTSLRNIEPKLLEHIANEIMDRDPMVRWDDIAGLEHAKKNVHEMVVYPLQRPDLFRGCRAPAKGLLLFGPPGTGKTMIGKAIAGEAKATFFSISASSIMSKWLGETEKLIRALFGVAACRQPAVVFIDEVDSVLSQRRSDGENDTSRKIKTQFLVEMEGCGTGTEQVLVIGATNRPQELDEAARRRLSKRLYIPLPSAAARSWIVRNLLGKDGLFSLSDEEMDAICASTDGYSGSDMKNLVKEASMGPLRDALMLGRSITDISNDELRAISLKDFMTALQQVRSSVSPDDIGQYEDWNKKYGSLSI